MGNDEHLRKAFSYFDKDGNGYIEPEELQNALMEDGLEDCTNVANDIFQEVDTDKVNPSRYHLVFCAVLSFCFFVFGCEMNGPREEEMTGS